MSNPIAMPDLGSDVYLRFTLGDAAQVQSALKGSGRSLSSSDPDTIVYALSYGLKRSDGAYIRNLSPYGPLDLNDIPVPLSTLVARIHQALQQATTG